MIAVKAIYNCTEDDLLFGIITEFSLGIWYWFFRWNIFILLLKTGVRSKWALNVLEYLSTRVF